MSNNNSNSIYGERIRIKRLFTPVAVAAIMLVGCDPPPTVAPPGDLSDPLRAQQEMYAKDGDAAEQNMMRRMEAIYPHWFNELPNGELEWSEAGREAMGVEDLVESDKDR